MLLSGKESEPRTQLGRVRIEKLRCGIQSRPRPVRAPLAPDACVIAILARIGDRVHRLHVKQDWQRGDRHPATQSTSKLQFVGEGLPCGAWLALVVGASRDTKRICQLLHAAELRAIHPGPLMRYSSTRLDCGSCWRQGLIRRAQSSAHAGPLAQLGWCLMEPSEHCPRTCTQRRRERVNRCRRRRACTCRRAGRRRRLGCRITIGRKQPVPTLQLRSVSKVHVAASNMAAHIARLRCLRSKRCIR